jgi:hypothetical protein
MTAITAQKMVEDILKIMSDVASEYPEEDRERLKAVMLGHLGMAMFNGPVVIDEKLKEKNERTL